jgi:transglutaminase-like putative cysteine protease
LHAWFEAFVGGRWYTFDGTQDKPRGGRIVVAYGRDAADVAFLSNYGPLPNRPGSDSLRWKRRHVFRHGDADALESRSFPGKQ